MHNAGQWNLKTFHTLPALISKELNRLFCGTAAKGPLQFARHKEI